jgi:hypothetical protein
MRAEVWWIVAGAAIAAGCLVVGLGRGCERPRRCGTGRRRVRRGGDIRRFRALRERRGSGLALLPWALLVSNQ